MTLAAVLFLTSPLALPGGSGATVVGDPAVTGSAERGMTGDLVRRSRPSDCRPARSEIRRRISERRSATWSWQDRLELSRTRSSHRERSAIGCSYLRWIRGLWAGRADEGWRLYAKVATDAVAAIDFVFGRYADQARKVAWCESRYSRHAQNGQYLGLFQMGSSERARFGHGETFLEQARAAYRYFVASGRDWSPWQCRPWGLAW